MRIIKLIIVTLLILSTFCTNSNDLSVTQTGNPVKANIYYDADTAAVRIPVKRSDFQVSEIKILSAKIVISEIRAKSSEDNDSLDFRNEEPVILDLDLGGGQSFLDSAITFSGTTFERIRYRIDQLDIDHGSIYSENQDLQDKSVLIQGYVDNDTLKVFSFYTDLDETIEFEFESPITIPEVSEFNFFMQFKINSWFLDKDGGLLDPRVDQNKSEIEGNIKNSIKFST